MRSGVFSVFTSRPFTVTILLIVLAILILPPHMAPGSAKAAAASLCQIDALLNSSSRSECRNQYFGGHDPWLDILSLPIISVGTVT